MLARQGCLGGWGGLMVLAGHGSGAEEEGRREQVITIWKGTIAP